MKILVFLHGTIIMHEGADGKTREERVRQVIDGETSVRDYASYIPVGDAVQKLKSWESQGAEILYLSSHKEMTGIGEDRSVLEKYDFPQGKIFYRREDKSYGDIAERIIPDVLIEDDCESIGGEREMTIASVNPEIKERIKSIIVPEFGGIDHLPEKIGNL